MDQANSSDGRGIRSIARVKFKNGHAASLRPVWDSLHRTLLFAGNVVKQFGRPSPNAEALLEEFQRRNWARRIEDPLPSVPGRNRKRRLHETIQNLNRRLDCPILIFRGDGSGKGVRWNLT